MCPNLKDLDCPKVERGWSCFKVESPLDFSLTGILSSILKPLAENGIIIFAISTFDTDYVLVRSDKKSEALSSLKKYGFKI